MYHAHPLQHNIGSPASPTTLCDLHKLFVRQICQNQQGAPANQPPHLIASPPKSALSITPPSGVSLPPPQTAALFVVLNGPATRRAELSEALRALSHAPISSALSPNRYRTTCPASGSSPPDPLSLRERGNEGWVSFRSARQGFGCVDRSAVRHARAMDPLRRLSAAERFARARELRHNPTPAERHTWTLLRNRGILVLKFRRQHVLHGFIVDFYCPSERI